MVTGFKPATYVLSGFLLIISLLHLLVRMILLFIKYYKKPKESKRVFLPVLERFQNYLQGIAFILAILFSIMTILNTATNGLHERGTWHIGLFAVLFGWMYFIHLCSKIPVVGEQAIVFLHIMRTFLKLTLFALLLVLAATIILAMTFFDAQALVSSCHVHTCMVIHYSLFLAIAFQHIWKRNNHSDDDGYWCTRI